MKDFDQCDATSVSGRELRVVVNTNDPEYEHIYSIEALDDPMDDMVYFSTESGNLTEGTLCLIRFVICVPFFMSQVKIFAFNSI